MRAVLGNGRQYAEDCVFRHCGVAFQEGGCLDAKAVR
jgi:hypothetical protein